MKKENRNLNKSYHQNSMIEPSNKKGTQKSSKQQWKVFNQLKEKTKTDKTKAASQKNYKPKFIFKEVKTNQQQELSYIDRSLTDKWGKQNQIKYSNISNTFTNSPIGCVSSKSYYNNLMSVQSRNKSTILTKRSYKQKRDSEQDLQEDDSRQIYQIKQRKRLEKYQQNDQEEDYQPNFGEYSANDDFMRSRAQTQIIHQNKNSSFELLRKTKDYDISNSQLINREPLQMKSKHRRKPQLQLSVHNNNDQRALIDELERHKLQMQERTQSFNQVMMLSKQIVMNMYKTLNSDQEEEARVLKNKMNWIKGQCKQLLCAYQLLDQEN